MYRNRFSRARLVRALFVALVTAAVLSGQLGNLPGSMQLAPGGIKAEAGQALENVKRILEANGSSMDRIVKCTVMMADRGIEAALRDDPHLLAGLNVYRGKVTYQAVARATEQTYTDPRSLLGG